MMLLTELLLGVAATVLVVCRVTEAQRFSLKGVSYPNHGLVLRDNIGETDNDDLDPDNGLHCKSFSGCCVNPVPTEQRGEFVFPGGTPVPILGGVGVTGYYRNRVGDRIILNRLPTGTIQGIFECQIRTESAQTTYDSFYIGVYDADSGSPSIDDVNYDSGSKALTCSSSGGPATTVTWRRNCLILQSSDFVQNQVVTNTELATYNNTLMFNGVIIDGVYTCSVKNSRGYSSSTMGIGTGYTPDLPVSVTITPSGTPVAGQSFTLICEATTSLTSPSYQWFNDSGNLVGNVSTLTLNPLLESNTGEYSCQVTAGSDAGQRFGCGVTRVVVQAPPLTVTVNNADNAVAGGGHTLSCTVMGANLSTATVMYTWRMNGVDIPGASANQYIISSVRVSDAGDVYTCQVTVTASYWDVSGSFGGSGSATLIVNIPTPTIQFTKLTLGSLYVGLNFTWRCDVSIPGNQLAGVSAAVEWRRPNGDILTSDRRITFGGVVESSPGRTFQRSVMFSPLSAGDSGTYSCTGTVMPSMVNSNVKNGVGTGNDSLSVTSPTVTVTIHRSCVPSQVLDLPSYNGFSLTCSTTSRVLTGEVPITKVITWMRSVDGGNAQVLDMTDANDVIIISNMDLDMATATSELMVNTTLPGNHSYTCSARLAVMPAPDDIRGQDSTTIVVQGEASPNPPTGLSASSITHNSATIQWTVTSLAYGPEMYMVVYGTDMSNLNQTSSMETSGNDITRTNFNLNVRLSGLDMMTTYYYRVVAMNSGGRMTQSAVTGTFNTTGLVPDPPTMLEGVASTNPADPPSISFTWRAPNVTNGDILDYRLSCTVPEDVPTPRNVTSLTTSATISSLNNGVEYCCNVSASNAQGYSVLSVGHCVTTVEIAPNGTVQNFAVQVTGARNLTFTWLPPIITERNGLITSYNLTCVNTTAGREALLMRAYQAAESNLYLLTGFKPFTAYTCRVFAINSAGRGPEATISQTTFQDEPDGPPQDITSALVAGIPSQVMFNFNPPREDLQNGVITRYRVSCADRGRSREPVSDNFPSNQARPYTLMNLIPATLYNCSLSASTSVGFGVAATVEVLTMPDKPTIVSVTPNSQSLVVMWNYINPLVSEGAVISGYHVYLDSQRVQKIPNSAVTTFNIASLSPFTNYSVEISAYNTREDGTEQEGPRSDPVTEMTLQDLPDSPGCQWLSASLSSVTVNWTSPRKPNGIITAYHIRLLSLDGRREIRSVTVDLSLSVQRTTLGGLQLVVGVRYRVQVFAENGAGNGSLCNLTNFADQRPPGDNLAQSIKITRIDEGRAANLSWPVLSIDQVEGNVSFEISYSQSGRKRQAGGGPVECTQPPCRVPYEQGSVIVRDLNPDQTVSFEIVAVNGEGEQGNAITLMSEPPSVSPPLAGPSVTIIIIVVIILILVVVVMVTIIIIIYVFRAKRGRSGTKRLYSPGHHIASKGVEMDERKLALDDDSRQSNRTPSPLSPEKAPSPVDSPEPHEVDRLQPVQVEYFSEHVKNMHENRDKRFEREYQSLPNDTTIPAEAAANNKPKNRFANIHPYDFSRVKLSVIAGVEGSDYINASYIDGYNKLNAYIAAQGPMPNTSGDFWRMIWENGLSTVVMLTKITEGGKRKCEQYWPDNVHDTYNPRDTTLVVTFDEVQPYADYEIRKLVVTNPSDPQSSPLTVSHFHFLGWPDHGVPQFATALIGFIRRVRSKYRKEGPPMLVHCSAGVGRTGTFIALDTMLERMEHEKNVNVYEFLRSMRAKRTQMVQTQAQYVFIHDALEELIKCGDTSIASHNLRMKLGNLGKIVPGNIITGFQHQFELLAEVSRKPTDKDYADALQHYNSAKNRYKDRLPLNSSRVHLRPTGATGADYINASFVDGYKKRNAYIAAQAPLKNTQNDFWRMIWEFKSKCIVMLCNLLERGEESSCAYWPTTLEEPKTYGKLIVTLKAEKEDNEFVVRKFEITEDKSPSAFGSEKTPVSFVVTQFHFSGWEELGRPDVSTGILQMSESVNAVQRSTGNKPITVVCNDGVGRTGTFICIHAQLERVKTEGVVDFFLFVKSSRISRPNLVSELEYYIFCHHTLADYLDTFDTYANFKDLGSAIL